MEKRVDLNCDLGESYGTFKVGRDSEIMPWITSCNIACGFHGGDPLTIRKTIDLALEHDVQIGAHPSYPDLAGFGRRVMEVAQDELDSLVKYQVSALKGMTEATGGRLRHVKPHGALYNVMSTNEEVARTIIRAVAAIDQSLYVVGPAGRPWKAIAEEEGILFAEEVFADRNYMDDLTLVPRTREDALIGDVHARLVHARMMVLDGCVRTVSGKEVLICGDTICIHGDHPLAPDTAKALSQGLAEENVLVTSFAGS